MSFSLNTKEELCQVPLHRSCCIVAEAFAVLLYCSTFHGKQVRLSTQSRAFATRLPILFQKAFAVTFDSLPTTLPTTLPIEGEKFHFTLHSPEKIQKIFQNLGYQEENLSCHINFSLLEDNCCRFAFCRGAFLAGGSVTSPQKNYHLELVTSHLQVSRSLPVLLHEHDFSPKSSQRKGHYISYFKQSNHIEDFLTGIGAPISAMEIMNVKLEKNLTSSINRLVNCDAANLGKAVDAAQSQIASIRYLEQEGILAQLPQKLQETASLRCLHPDCTLSQLAEYFTPPISKSALNHRLRKISALAEHKE